MNILAYSLQKGMLIAICLLKIIIMGVFHLKPTTLCLKNFSYIVYDRFYSKLTRFLKKNIFSKIFLSSSLEFKRYSLDPSCSTRKGTFAAKWYLRFEFESASFATSDEISNRFSVGKFSFQCSKSVFSVKNSPTHASSTVFGEQ